MEYVKIHGKVYSRHEFATHFGLSYRRVLTLYNRGYRDEKLLSRLQYEQDTKHIVINGHDFRSKREAAKFYHMPSSTFYRRYKNGTLTIDDFTTTKRNH